MAIADLLTLTKPRITLMVVGTGAVGLVMAPGVVTGARFAWWFAGLWLLVSGANALNMWWERDTDGQMARTRSRPLPAGRLSPHVALRFGLAISALAVVLLCGLNLTTGLLGAAAWAIYVLGYTPLKRRSRYALHVGAVAGAIPPLLGWTAVTGSFGAPGAVLFGILFLWQLPHFVAISLFRNREYARAGLAVGVAGRSAKLQLAAYPVPLVALSALPCWLQMAGGWYLAFSMGLGAVFLALGAVGLRQSAGERWARSVFAYSMVYLAGLLLVLVVDRV